MKMVKIVGSITSTIKEKTLEGFKLFLVQTVGVDFKPGKDYFVAVDTVGLGIGEIALLVTGSAAKKNELTKGKNVDGTLVARVDSIDLN
jgi:ethanolamine utilization protein EutN